MAIIKQEKKIIVISGYGLIVEENQDKEETCGVCGGRQVYIRGRYPSHDNRLTCPTCTKERLDQILELANPDYGKSYQEKSDDSSRKRTESNE